MNYQRSPELWFEDGNVILESEGIVYRVFRGILAHHSPIFADMFCVPQAPIDQELHDGLPIIHMPDAGQDIVYFLQALHTSFYERNDEGIVDSPLSVTISILRMSTKYNVPHLRARALRHLATFYPADLASWRDTPGQAEVHPFVVANVARECRAALSLPAALLQCCSSTILDILEGITLPGSAERLRLSPLNSLACLRARSTLLVAPFTRINLWMAADDTYPDYYPGSGYCDARDSCNDVRRQAFADILLRTKEDTVAPFDAFLDSVALKELCTPCLGLGKKRYGNAQDELWQELPALFDLASWEELIEESSASD